MVLDHLKDSINSVFVGKEETIDLLLVALLSNGHILLEDVPGTGKTLLAKTIAKSIGGTFSRIQFTPDVLPSDVIGLEYFNPKHGEFEKRIGPIYANIVLADEINRAMPRTQSSLLEAMEERQITIEKQTDPLPTPFLVIATQNPGESHGTFPLPDAQLDRFLVKINLGYPTRQEERKIMKRFRTEDPMDNVSPVISMDEVRNLQEETKQIHISECIEDYVLDLVESTRNHKWIEVGLSPRATLAMLRAAQAKAKIESRTYCIPEDIQFVFPYISSHRIMLSMEGALHITKSQVIQSILDNIDVPVEISYEN
jgi:MoxR-like ATPase